MIQLSPRAMPVSLASILLAVTTAFAQSWGAPYAAAQNPAVQGPAAEGPAIRSPALQAPLPPGVEGLPAYENESPFADVLQAPTRPDAPTGSLVSPEADSPYSYEGSPEAYGPRLPGRVRSYIENRPRQQPLQTESWLNRPISASFFLGGLFLDDPMPGLEGDAGVLFGGRLGWDFAPRFGVEARLGGGSPGVSSSIFNFELPQANVFFTDLNWLWYPTGDTRWRPYVSAGTGLFDLDLVDLTNHRFHESLFEVPLGIGMKYRYSTRMVMRFELMDHFAFGTGRLEDLHNLSFTAGLETRFGGGNRKSYWPWKPDHDWR